MTLEEKIELLKAMYENDHAISKYYKKKGDDKNAKKHLRDAIVLHDVITILTNDEYAQKIQDIFKGEEK